MSQIIILFSLFFFAFTIENVNNKRNIDEIFTVIEGNFHLNGEKFNIYAGEIHYFRIAACEWEDRLRKLQRAGLNTVSTAVEWAMHEPIPKSYNWKGNANFTRFIELAHRLDLFVIVRAGPYIGVDRSLGGIPGWLLTTNELKDNPWIQRSSPEYRLYAERWLSHLLPKLSKMMITNGGPILMVQIDSDLGETTPCMTTDWLHEIYQQYLNVKTIMFTMDENNLKNLKCGLTWNWNSERFTFGTKKIIKTINDIIKSDASIIIYMFAGGTNFERAGKSNFNKMGLTTSYDYDGIISESGDVTEKFYKLQSIFHQNSEIIINDNTKENKQGTVDISGQINFTSLGSLLDSNFRNNLKIIGIESKYPMTFAKLNITNGLVLYETKIPFKMEKEIILYSKEIHDRGYIYFNGNLLGILDKNYNSLKISMDFKYQIIQILVENTGYLAQNVIGEPKGINNVYLNDKILKNWIQYPLNLDNVKYLQEIVKNLKPSLSLNKENSFLLAKFQIPNNIMHSTLHTYLNMNHHSAKGYVFLNEYSIGKYWINGPQYELYIPECYFQPMENQLLIIQLQKKHADKNTTPLTIKKTIYLDKSGEYSSSKYENENLISYILLFYICWFWKPGYSCICC
ncbi:beta-galactosidase-like isoform X2 [Leptopilina boulardi]|uniref:beta-galactosidase-like isoform X2 n=1 Tax=Leptopilina boulardi TaxID=63433 RepID=UPI0021F5FE60|nr:beta-galactosidase-like isoform X2 [Leptopilina boulardi]